MRQSRVKLSVYVCSRRILWDQKVACMIMEVPLFRRVLDELMYNVCREYNRVGT